MSCGCGCGGSGVGSVGGGSGCYRRQNLAQRLAPRADKIRQKLTDFGLRPYDVFLVWTRWDGEERGEGYERELRRVRIVPNPKVEDLTSISLSPYAAGILPVGSIRLSEISISLTADDLAGRTIPGASYPGHCSIQRLPSQGTPDSVAMTPGQQVGHALARVHDHISQPFEFFYEVVENVAGTSAVAPALRPKFRPLSPAFKRPGKFDWMLILERISEDRNRYGRSQMGTDSEV